MFLRRWSLSGPSAIHITQLHCLNASAPPSLFGKPYSVYVVTNQGFGIGGGKQNETPYNAPALALDSEAECCWSASAYSLRSGSCLVCSRVLRGHRPLCPLVDGVVLQLLDAAVRVAAC